jgi:hypothetical protein
MDTIDGKDKKHGSMNTYKRHCMIAGRREKVKVITAVTLRFFRDVVSCQPANSY